MPTPSTAHLPPPKSWDEFEEICADLFSVEWGDRNATRHGRQGQRQNGVDIYGCPDGSLAGVQCKGKRAWPPKPLKTGDIDTEVTKAKKFRPALTEFIIATTAPDDAKLQDHARAITERHKKKRLFSVHVVGWDELIRRLTQYSLLVEKHYGHVALTSLRKEIPEATANIVVERLREIGVGAPGLTSASPQTVVGGENALQAGFTTAALERDLAHRYNKALQCSFFPEVSKIDGFHLLAKEVFEGEFSLVSEALRRRIFLHAARSTAFRGELDEAERFLAAATSLVGPDTDLPARARLAEGRGDIDSAIQILRDANDADAQSTLFNILMRHRGDAVALAWLAEHKLSVSDLTVGGIHTLVMIHLQHDDYQKTRDILIQATDAQLADAPNFLFLRSAVRLATLFPRPDQWQPLRGVPLDVRSGHTILADEIVTAELDAAITDLNQFQSIVSKLGLRDARRLAEAYITWCHLLHPVSRNAAVERLRTDMAKPVTALPRLQFAFAYDSEFDPTPITRYLENREQLGGLDEEELRAALVLRLHSDEPREIADFIARYRTRLETIFGKAGVVSIEIQALALAKDTTSARLALDQNRDLIDSNLIRLLEAEIARADGSDPVAEYKRVYEDTKSPEALRALVSELVRRKDHRAVAHYAEDLYAKTNDPRDAVVTANALASAGDDVGFMRVVDAYPFVKEHNPALARHQAWKLFELGRISSAKQIAEELRASHEAKYRDLDLEIAIAVESGDWEALAIPLNAYLENAADHSGLALIRAAQLSQVSGQGPFAGLLNAAVERSLEDPSVLIGAYSMVIEEGLEDKRPEANAWFQSALDLSGPDGPVKRFELKELLSQQIAWNERTREINDSIIKGDLPLIFAASGLRTTLVDVILRNLFRNVTLSDPRKRTALPLFSGRRKPSSMGDVSRLAIDQSALMVLAWLGLLPKVIQTYSEIVLPAGALQELFQGRSRIRQFQKSRVERARDIQSAVVRRRLKVHRSPSALHDPLAREVGLELASLLKAAQATNGFVVRPAPVIRVGLENDGEADLSVFKDTLVDMRSVLVALTEHGAIDQASEETARRYFEVQDKGWPSPPVLTATRPLFIDSLALVYLQTVNLLDAVLDSFGDVSIDSSTEEEASALIVYEHNVGEVLRIIDEVRGAVQIARESNKLVFGPLRKTSRDEGHEHDEDGVKEQSSTLNLISDLMKSDAVVFDDRAFNKEQFAVDNQGHRARLVSSLDIIEDLTERGVITETERRTFRHRLRVAGAVLVPVDTEEIVNAALRNRQNESPEFRAIRDNIGLARIAEVPRFPSEIPWFGAVSTAAQHALIQVWAHEIDSARAARIAEAILDLRPRPDEWVARWEGSPPPEWSVAVLTIMTASMALPIELKSDEATQAYNEWLEHHVLAPLRDTAPELSRRVVEKIRGLLLHTRGEDDDAEA